MQHLGQVGLHATALPGSQDDDGKLTSGHGRARAVQRRSVGEAWGRGGEHRKRPAPEVAQTVARPEFSPPINICCRLLQRAGAATTSRELRRSEEHTSAIQSLMINSYTDF